MNKMFPFKSGYVILRVTRSLHENGALPDLSNSITRYSPEGHISIISYSRYIRNKV